MLSAVGVLIGASSSAMCNAQLRVNERVIKPFNRHPNRQLRYIRNARSQRF